MQDQAVQIVGAQILQRQRSGLRHLFRQGRLRIVGYLPWLLPRHRRELGLYVEVGALQARIEAGGDAGADPRLVVVLGLAGRVNAAEAGLDGTLDQPLGLILLPCSAVKDVYPHHSTLS